LAKIFKILAIPRLPLPHPKFTLKKISFSSALPKCKEIEPKKEKNQKTLGC